MFSISIIQRCLGTFLLCLCTTLPLMAGGGTVHQSGAQQGQIDFTVNFTFPPDADTLNGFKQAVIEASAIICQATEGQMRFGTVTITGGTSVNQDLADMWVHPEDARANANICFMGPGIPCYALEVPGARTNIYTDRFLSLYYDPLTIAHEMGHLALDLGDEYDEQNYQGSCWGIGPCIEFDQTDDVNNCMMQQENPLFPSPPPFELCVAANHDSLQGDPMTPACTDPAMLACPPPCATNCQLWNPNTCRYETTMQTAHSTGKFGTNLDCWSHVSMIHTFLTPPAGLPSAATPACDEPTFIDAMDAIDQVVLVLDRSWSMRLLPGQGPCAGPGCPEICDNTLDDDGDGVADEMDCLDGRLSFVKNTAKLFLNLIKGGGLIDPISADAGLLSFQCNTNNLTGGLEPVTNTNIQTIFAPLIDGLAPNGNTAIGDALANATNLFPGGADLSPNRAIFLLTDGFNNCGTFVPSAMAGLLDALGTRVFMITTEDGNDDALGELAGATMGRALQTEKATDLMPAMALQVARHLNRGLLIPKLSYRIASTGQFENARNARGSLEWFDNESVPKGTHPLTTPVLQSNIFEFYVEEGTSQVTLNFAGDMNVMAHFGIRARLSGPSGPNPKSFDSEAAALSPLFSVTKEKFFTLLTLRRPNPGLWRVQVTSTDPNGPGHLQTGFVTVMSENQRAQLATSLNRYVLEAPNAGDVLLSAFPSFDTDLRDAKIRARLHRPDGSVVDLAVEDNTDRNAGYLVRVQQTPLTGQYEIRLHLETQPGRTSNHPGESIFQNSPSSETIVPKMIRTAVETFVVQKRGHTRQ